MVLGPSGFWKLWMILHEASIPQPQETTGCQKSWGLTLRQGTAPISLVRTYPWLLPNLELKLLGVCSLRTVCCRFSQRYSATPKMQPAPAITAIYVADTSPSRDSSHLKSEGIGSPPSLPTRHARAHTHTHTHTKKNTHIHTDTKTHTQNTHTHTHKHTPKNKNAHTHTKHTHTHKTHAHT